MSLVNKLNRAKQGADSLLDPFLAVAAYNFSVLEATHQLSQSGNEFVEGLGMIAGGTALTWGNKALFKGIKESKSPLIKIKERALEAYTAGRTADWKNWTKTGVIVSALGLGLHNAEITKPKVEESTMDFNRVRQEEVLEVAPLEELVERTKPLTKKTVLPGTLYSYYTGIEGTFNDNYELPTNKEVLTALWDKKFEKYSKTGAKAHLYDELVLKFDEATNHRISLKDYIAEFNEIIDEVRDNINWESMIGRHVWGKHREQKLNILQSYANQISAEDIVSISMKELLPPEDAEYKAETLDFIYSVRGKQFADLIPSLHDNLASIGPGQLTSNVINEKNQGASGINEYLPSNMQLPDSIIELRGWDQEQAKYQNLIAQLADGLSRINDEKTLKYMEKMNDEDFHLYLGGLHHRPVDAANAISLWAANNAEYPLITSMNQRLTNYNLQVKQNKAGLQCYLSKQEVREL